MSNDMRAVCGNTYAHKDELKRLGGVWDFSADCWFVPASRYGEAREVMGDDLEDSVTVGRGFRREVIRLSKTRANIVSNMETGCKMVVLDDAGAYSISDRLANLLRENVGVASSLVELNGMFVIISTMEVYRCRLQMEDDLQQMENW